MDKEMHMRGRRFITGRVVAVMAAGVLLVVNQPVSGQTPAPLPAAVPCPEAARPCRDTGGPAVVTEQDGFTPLNSGTAATTWTLKLPQAASCSGDTAIGNFHVFTYVAPASVDPATLTFGSIGPKDNPAAFPLVDDGGSPFIAGNTGISTGQVAPVPFTRLRWGNPPTPFDSTVTPPGTYNVGIACADGAGANDKFWNVQETFSGDPTIATGAGAFAWTAAAADPGATTTMNPPGGSTTSTSSVSGASTTSTTLSTSSSSTTSTTTSDGSTTSTSTTVVGDGATSAGSSSGGSDSSGAGGSSSGGLALTGASVLRIGGLGVVLFALGWGVDVLSRRRRPQRREP